MKKKKNTKRIIGDIVRISILLIALSVLLYPTISNYLYDKNSSKVISLYDDTSEKLQKEEEKEILYAARDYNSELLKNVELLDPFSTKKKEYGEWYQSLLNIDGAGMMGYIEIPAIRVKLPIYHGTEENVLQSGVGHFEGTSLPVGGKSTHAVLTGHRGLVSKDLFINVDKLKEGDRFFIKMMNETLAYKVDQILTVLPSETEELSIISEKDYVTLVTCTPYGVNTHRLLVRGTRIPYFEHCNEVGQIEEKTGLPLYVKALVAGIVCVTFILLATWIYSKKRTKGRR